MKLGVVILNWNGIEVTPKCLGSLYRSTRIPEEIVVVDNASRDHSAELIRDSYPDATLIRNSENLGFSGGCNVGIRYLLDREFDLILLLNNDAEVASDCLEKLIAAAMSVDAAAYTATIYEAATPSRIWYSGGTLNLLTLEAKHTINPPRLNQLPSPTEFISGCCVLMTSAALREIGLLDEIFFAYYEDLDWCLRARRAGRRLVYVPQASLYHDISHTFRRAGRLTEPTTESKWAQKRPVVLYLSYRNRGILARKHARGLLHLSFLLTRLMARAIAHASLLLFARNAVKAGAVLHGIRDGISGRPTPPAVGRYL